MITYSACSAKEFRQSFLGYVSHQTTFVLVVVAAVEQELASCVHV
jgi:DNA/RNA-binding domain of Phe-tRNA-synthetase-like protein